MGIYKIPKVIGIDRKPPFGARVNWHHPLSQGLVGAWLCNEMVGKNLYNLALNRKSDDFPAICSRENDYLYFISDHTDNIDVDTSGKAFAFEKTDPFSVLVRFSLNTNSAYKVIIGNLGAATAYPGWSIDVNGDEIRINFICNIGTSDNIVIETNARNLSANTIYTALCTYDGLNSRDTSFNIYVDGIKCNISPSGAASITGSTVSTANLALANRIVPSNTNDFNGKLYFVYVWKRIIKDIQSVFLNPYQMFWHPMRDIYYAPTAAPPPTGGKSIFGYDSIFHAGGIIQQ